MKPTHKIYLCNVNFAEKASSSDEKELRMTSEIYKNIFNKRNQSSHIKFSGVNSINFAGLVDYLPTEYGGDINKEANILIYLYKDKAILSHAYKRCIIFINDFINKNKITSIQLSGDDVNRLNVNGIDIVNDIKTKVLHDLDITITEQKHSAYGYHLI